MCKSAPRSTQMSTPAPQQSVFYRPDALPATLPTASKHWRHNEQATYINSTDYSVDSQPNYRHLYYILRYPLLSFNTHEWYRTFKNVGYAAPANGDFCLWSSYIFHIVHKSLLFKFRIGSIKHCSTSLLGLLVKCGTAECGMRKVKCGMETVEDGVEYAFVIYVSQVIF